MAGGAVEGVAKSPWGGGGGGGGGARPTGPAETVRLISPLVISIPAPQASSALLEIRLLLRLSL